MKVRIDEVGSILDDQIIRAALISRIKPSVADYEENIIKAITFDPSNIREINSAEGSQYYTPYQQSVDGGFYPYSVEHWAGQGKNPEDYRDVHDFYAKLGVVQDSLDALKVVHGQGKKFSFLVRSINYPKEEIIYDEKVYIIESELFIRSDVIEDIGKFFISNKIFRHFVLDLPGIDEFFIRTS